MYGKAKTGKDDSEEMLCADVDLVVVGVSKDATESQLKDFIINKGITVLEIEKLTKAEEARTNTFRVRIKASEYEKAMNPDVWPYRVGVRHFIPPKRKPQQQQSWEAQSAQAGGRINPQQQQRGYRGHHSHNGYNQGYGSYGQQHQQKYAGQGPQQPEGQYQQAGQYQYGPGVPQPGVITQNRFNVDGFAREVPN